MHAESLLHNDALPDGSGAGLPKVRKMTGLPGSRLNSHSVDIKLTTHSSGDTVTDLDVELAERIATCLERHPPVDAPRFPSERTLPG